MPQTFQVLRCFQCLVFQVHPTKKANKWKCKMCGEKQSIKRYYGLGTGKECRLHVQKLNGIQGEIHNEQLHSEDSDDIPKSPESQEQCKTLSRGIIKKSKWENYVEVEEEDEDDKHSPDKDMHLNETKVVLELPKKRPRKSQQVINKTISFPNENKHVPSTKVFNNHAKDNTVKSKQCNDAATNLGQIQIDQQTKTERPKICVLTPTVSNSKWAQFVENTKYSNNADPVVSSKEAFGNDPAIMFSLFDDDNLDTILDF